MDDDLTARTNELQAFYAWINSKGWHDEPADFRIKVYLRTFPGRTFALALALLQEREAQLTAKKEGPDENLGQRRPERPAE